MFSANENILLRQHKRKVIEFIEATIPENALDLGTTVMVMQVSCRQPGCVPLETAITIVFPRPPQKAKKKGADMASEVPSFPDALIPGLEESRIGGSFKTRILKPLAEVTNDDVLDALPPEFRGGRRTMESICLKARDTLFAQIGQLVGNDDTTDGKEGRSLVANYLQKCLAEYVERDCVAPEWGEEFDVLDEKERKQTNDGNRQNKWGTGNIVFRRPVEDQIETPPMQSKELKSASQKHIYSQSTRLKIASSQEMLQQMSESKHAPGIRRAGCPCCDPDSTSTYVDNMML